MQENGLKVRTRKRFTLTTMRDHDQPVAANLLDRQFEAAAPNQRWVGSRACGVPHPALITADHLELLDSRFGSTTVADLFGYGRGFGLPSDVDVEAVRRLL